MLRLTMLLAMTALVSLAAPSNCAPGTLTDYLGLDLEGCRLGNRVISNFSLDPLTQGASEINPNSVQVTPFAGGVTGSLLFTYNASAASAAVLESIFQLTVMPDTFAPDKVDLQLIGATASGDGVVTGVVDLCADGIIGGLCQGNSQPIIALLSSADDLTLASAIIGPTTRYDLLHDVVADAGLLGTASLSSAHLTFTTVPEPGTWVTLAAGLAGLFVLRRRRLNR